MVFLEAACIISFQCSKYYYIANKCILISCSDSRLVNGRWNTTGCERNDSLSNSTHTVCECTHLTNFAILLSSQPIVGGVHAFVLGLIGYIGVTLSVLAMLATIVALVYLRLVFFQTASFTEVLL